MKDYPFFSNVGERDKRGFSGVNESDGDTKCAEEAHDHKPTNFDLSYGLAPTNEEQFHP